VPYKRIPPADVSWMRKNRYLGHFTICEKLREIYRMTDNEEIKLKCREAMAMAKRMQEALKTRPGYLESDDNYGEPNPENPNV